MRLFILSLHGKFKQKSVFIRPKIFAKFAFCPETFQKFYFRFSVFGQNDADGIIAKFNLTQMKNFSIHPGGADNLPLFSQVYRGKRRREIVGTARFDFDKTERRRVVSNQINFARHNRAETVSADRRFEISADDSITVFEQKFQREPFAFRAESA